MSLVTAKSGVYTLLMSLEKVFEMFVIVTQSREPDKFVFLIDNWGDMGNSLKYGYDLEMF